MEKTDEPGAEAAFSPNVDDVEEEFWSAPPSLLTEHKIHTLRFGSVGDDSDGDSSSSIALRYKSMPSGELTPLDMVYGDRTGDENDEIKNVSFRDEEFYDGTGNLMWMAAVCFGHMVAQKVKPLRSYLFGEVPSPSLETVTGVNNENSFSHEKTRMLCELGCGTGGAGISLLLCNNRNSDCHVVFTDNDAQSLDLCASNCELNDLDPGSYSQKLLGWGSEESYRETATRHPLACGEAVEPRSFDVVFATDVVYDLKMIAPLFDTVGWLLKEKSNSESGIGGGDGGHLILSHVPRFCIPRDSDAGDGDDRDRKEESGGRDEPGEAFSELERLIEAEARRAGLVLAERIRPHQVLSEEGLCDRNDRCGNDRDDDSMQRLTLETMKEAHAVLFVFRRT